MKIIIFLFSVLLLAGCKKEEPDPCDAVSCLNGGVCNNGSCNCPAGWSGVNCEIPPDPCAGITCLNGGTCANGICNCPTGYTGGDCSLQVTPKYLEILEVVLTQFPATTDTGGPWDPSDGPDIYFRLTYNGNELYSNPANRKQNAVWGNTYTWTIPGSDNIQITNPTSQYVLEIYDYEILFSDTYMASVYFTPYWNGNAFPEVLQYNSLNCSDCKIYFKLKVSYHF